MKKVVFALSFIFIVLSSVNAQKTVNDFKYVIVPERYDFLKENDQYNLNTLTKFLLEKENLKVYMDNSALPKELAENRCLGLYTKVTDYSKLFKTKLKIELLDCYNNVILESELGETREKEYKAAYHEALRNAYQSIKGLNYSYTAKQSENKPLLVEDPEIVPGTPPKKIEAKTPKVEVKKPVAVEKPKPVKTTTPSVMVEKAIEIEKPKTPVIKKAPLKKPKEEIMVVVESYLKAQPTAYGFSIINNVDGKSVFDIIKTGKKDVFFVKGENAIVYKLESGIWKKETFSDSKIVVETLDIRF